MKVLLTFASIHYVLKAEKVLKAHGLSTEMIPVPKEISSDCGMALLISEEDLPQAQEILTGAIAPQGVYSYRRPGERFSLARRNNRGVLDKEAIRVSSK